MNLLFPLFVSFFISLGKENHEHPFIDEFTRGPVLLEKSLKLSCLCKNCPFLSAIIIWERDGLEIKDQKSFIRINNGSLTFLKADPSLTGEYRCFVVGNNSTSSIPPINVYYPHVENVGKDYKIVEKFVGDAFFLQCNQSIVISPTAIRYRVSFEHDLGSDSRIKEILGNLFFSYLKKSDSIFYECLAEIANGRQTVGTETIGLYVKNRKTTNQIPQSIPKILFPPVDDYIFLIRPSNLDDIDCFFDGNPTPSVEFYSVSGKRVEKSQMTHNGRYSCVGINFIGKSLRNYFQVQFIELPYGTVNQSTESVRDSEVGVYHLTTFKGFPVPKVIWYYGDYMEELKNDSDLIKKLDDRTIHVRFDAKKGPRRIICVIRNIYGSFYVDMRFSVKKVFEESFLVNSFIKRNETAFTFGIIFFAIFIVMLILAILIFRRRRKEFQRSKFELFKYENIGKFNSLITEKNDLHSCSSLPIRPRTEKPTSVVI